MLPVFKFAETIFGLCLLFSIFPCVFLKRTYSVKVKLFILSMALLSLASCTKSVDNIAGDIPATGQGITATASNQFIRYVILKGRQYCDKSTYQAVKYDQLSFIVKFDSSAIYHTLNKDNQDDINKLLGFSDNNTQHLQYSARFGWRWSNNALHQGKRIKN